MRRCTKFYCSILNICGDIPVPIYICFSKRRQAAILDFLKFQFSTFVKVRTDAVYHRAKVHCDSLNSCGDMTFLVLSVWLEMHIQDPVGCILGNFTPLNGERYQRDPQRHVFSRKKVIWLISSKSVQQCELWTTPKETRQWPRPPTLSQCHMDLRVCGHIRGK